MLAPPKTQLLRFVERAYHLARPASVSRGARPDALDNLRH
jgi:hypothetical protein